MPLIVFFSGNFFAPLAEQSWYNTLSPKITKGTGVKPLYLIYVIVLFTVCACVAFQSPSLASLPTTTPSIVMPTPTPCPRIDVEHIYTGRTRDATLITHKDMQHEIHTKVDNGLVLVLLENTSNGHQWMVYYLPTCKFGYIDKNEVVLEP